MKKIILNLIITLIINSTYSQVTKKSDLDDIKIIGKVNSLRVTSYKAVNRSGEIVKGKRKTENSYEKDSYTVFSNKGKIIEFTEYTSDGKIYMKLSYLYDDKGIRTELDNIDTNGVHTLMHKYINKYDETGNLIESNHFNAAGGDNSKYTYKYDDKGNLIEYNWFKKDGSFGSKDTYKYDEKGNKIEDDSYKSNGIIRWKFIYKYDDKGNCVEEEDYKGTKYYIKAYSKFDEKGNQIEFDWCKENGKPYRKYYQKYEYDKNGNWIKQTNFRNDKPTYIYERELTYF